jgi:hypothetical protein
VKVLALVYSDEDRWGSYTEEQRNEVYARHRAFHERAGEKILTGAELAPTRTATTVRVRNGGSEVTDGPFAETKEALGGFYVLDCKDLEEATELGAQIAAASTGAVELRPAAPDEQR